MPKTKKLLLLLAPLLILGGLVAYTPLKPAYASKCDKIQDLDERYDCYKEQEASTSKKLADVRNQKNDVSQKITGLLGQLNVTQAELNNLQNEITQMVAALEAINTVLIEKNEDLEDKMSFRNSVIRSYSKRGGLTDLELFLSSSRPANLTGFEYSTLNYMFEKALNLETRRLIGALNTEIYNYERDKEEAHQLKTDLETAQASLIAAKNTLETEKRVAQDNLDELAQRESSYAQALAEISAKQQEILAAKSGSFTFSLGSGEHADEYLSSAKGFYESAPKGYFAIFSFGAYSHRKGMSQYGARGRAEKGESYKDIINHYYGEEVKEIDTPNKVCVQGYGNLELQYYLYGLAEMPHSWPKDALRAQAIAGRTYALRYHNAGKCICTDENCQVFSQSKADNPPTPWKEAVDDTEGMIIGGGSHAMYSSTAGAYAIDSGWDTTNGKGGSDFIDRAYENIGNSPWLYKSWWREGYGNKGSTCGREDPWLSPEEMADIVNTHLVLSNGSKKDRDRLSPVTTSCWGGNPYSIKELRTVASKYGGISSATSINVIQGDGTTKSVVINDVSMSGAEFRTAFNLRAPGWLRIPQYPSTYGLPFFNIEKK